VRTGKRGWSGRGGGARVKTDEGRLERWGWRALVVAGAVVGPRVGRGLAALVLRARARTPAGWLEGVHRVATGPRRARRP
jgi:hypothetical protein